MQMRSSAQQLPPFKHAVPNQTQGFSSSALLTPQRPLVLYTVWVHCLLPGPSLGLLLCPSQGERATTWKERKDFSVFFCKIKQGYFWPPFRANQIYFLFSLSEPGVWQASCRGVKIRAHIFNAFAVFCSVSVLFVFLWLTVFRVSGLLRSSRSCSQAKESKTKLPWKGWGAWVREKERKEGKETEPQSVFRQVPLPSLILALPFMPSAFDQRDTGLHRSLLTWCSHMLGPKIPFFPMSTLLDSWLWNFVSVFWSNGFRGYKFRLTISTSTKLLDLSESRFSSHLH